MVSPVALSEEKAREMSIIPLGEDLVEICEAFEEPCSTSGTMLWERRKMTRIKGAQHIEGFL